ncbi:hypothetical protein [Pseudocitrobacter cyperus]|uniref:Uncharacterized protein n=1 Tax=Pseudocitrobacter cyperus TaxID=3112843 RepID=A0ABV0HI97_9ENTR
MCDPQIFAMIIILTINSWVIYLVHLFILFTLSMQWRYCLDLFWRVVAPQIGIALLFAFVFREMGDKKMFGMLWAASPVYQVPLLFAVLLTR